MKLGTIDKLFALLLVIPLVLSFAAQPMAQETITTVTTVANQCTTGVGHNENMNPQVGQSWTVFVPSTRVSYQFWISCDPPYKLDYFAFKPGEVAVNGYQIGVFTQNPEVPSSLVLNAKMFSLSQGVEVNGIFYFHLAWWTYNFTSGGGFSGSMLKVIELTDNHQLDGNKRPYFTPINLSNATQIASMAFSAQGTAVDSIGITDMPNGNAIVLVRNANGYADYWLYTLTRSTMTLSKFATVDHSVGGTMQVRYSNNFMFLTVGSAGGSSLQPLKVYQAPLGNLTNITLEATLPSVKHFVTAVTNDTLFVAAENSTYISIYKAPTTGTFGSLLNNVPLSYLMAWTDGGINPGMAITADDSAQGVHFYIDYIASSHIYLNLTYTSDDGNTWVTAGTIRDMTADNGNLKLDYAPSISTAQRPASGSPERDIVTEEAANNAGTNWFMDLNFVFLPAIVHMTETTTTVPTTYVTLTWTTITGLPSSILPIGDFGTWMLMFILPALFAGVFAVAGDALGGGNAGVVFMMVGVAIGLILGMFMGVYPWFTMGFIALALVAAFVTHSRGSSQPQQGG